VAELRNQISAAQSSSPRPQLIFFLIPGAVYALSGEPISLDGLNLTLLSEGAGATLDARGLSRLFEVGEGSVLTLQSLHLLNAQHRYKYSNSDPKSRLQASVMLLQDSQAYLIGCTITNRVGAHQVGAHYVSPGVSSLSHYRAGGLMSLFDSELHLTDCSITNFTVHGNGQYNTGYNTGLWTRVDDTVRRSNPRPS
jgi:hypothetical protein